MHTQPSSLILSCFKYGFPSNYCVENKAQAIHTWVWCDFNYSTVCPLKTNNILKSSKCFKDLVLELKLKRDMIIVLNKNSRFFYLGLFIEVYKISNAVVSFKLSNLTLGFGTNLKLGPNTFIKISILNFPSPKLFKH